MCVTRSCRVLEVDDRAGLAIVDCDGRIARVSTAPLVLDGRTVAPGDHVLVATGFVLEIVDDPKGAAP